MSRSAVMMVHSSTATLALAGVATIASCAYAGRAVGGDGRREPEPAPPRRNLPAFSTAQPIAAVAPAVAAAGARAEVPRPAAATVRPVARRAGFLELSSRAGVSATHVAATRNEPKPKVSAAEIKAVKPPELRRAARKQQGNPKRRTQGRAAQYRAETAKQRAKVVAAVAMAVAKVQQPLLVPLDTTTQRAQGKKERAERKVARANKKLAKDVVDRAFAAALAPMHEKHCHGVIVQASALLAEVTTEPTPTPEPLPQQQQQPVAVAFDAHDRGAGGQLSALRKRLKPTRRPTASPHRLDARDRGVGGQLSTPRKQLKPTRRPTASPHRLHQTPDPELVPEPAETQEHEVVAVLGDLARLSPVFSEETSPRADDEKQEDEEEARLKPFGVRLDQEAAVPSSYGLIRIGAQPAHDGSERCLVLRAGRAMGIGPSEVLTIWYGSSVAARYSAGGGQEGGECYDALCEPIFPSDQGGKLYLLGECASCGVCPEISLPGVGANVVI